METLDERRLVLIESTFEDSAGKDKYEFGTGYFITNELVLTAYHVVSPGSPEKIRVRPEKRASKDRWISAEPEPVWKRKQLDATLIKVPDSGLSDVEPPEWGNPDKYTDPNVPWFTSAYPNAYKDGDDWVKAYLDGDWKVRGGTG